MDSVMMESELLAMIQGRLVVIGAGCKIALFTDDTQVTQNLKIADLHEPTGDWYAREDAVFGEVFRDEDGKLCVEVTSAQFNYSGTDEGETIYIEGIVFEDTPDLLILAARRTSPKLMETVLDSLVSAPSYRIPPVGV